ncbi:hypothetical protein H5993_07325 [Lactobacillus alvi]|uniref:Uncharacterized protein n=1 Tax=Limosilactobacillus alvi TaxID=990412 RepID=A0ABS2ER70_9LACO|nr:hypothetical protein [Limosilactobacillus alvi]MBM6754566.1 hypothetical protein [Limosilactobacillus alvi]
MAWSDNDIYGASKYWIERFCDRYGISANFYQVAHVLRVDFPAPNGGVHKIYLDDELMQLQMNRVERQEALAILESWLILAIASIDPIQAKKWDQADYQYFNGMSQAIKRFRLYDRKD